MNLTFPIPFVKMSGAGNDFIVIDHRESFLNKDEKSELARLVCRRRFSVGADGCIFIERSDIVDFSWDFYNSDGSIAEMCGNGARCAARFAYDKGIGGVSLSFETIAGVMHAEICEDRSVRLSMTQPFDFKECQPIMLGEQERKAHFVNTGVPHAVFFVSDEESPVQEWGALVRFDEQFQPSGTNVSFVTKLGDGRFRSRTYERGVEEETRACGTGAVASALYIVLEKMAESPVTIITSGGDELTISFDLHQGPVAENVVMQGPARVIYEGQLTAESIL